MILLFWELSSVINFTFQMYVCKKKTRNNNGKIFPETTIEKFSLFKLTAALIKLAMYLFSGPTEYCHREVFNATCETNEVVVMQMARYGRMSLGKCIKIDLGYLGCVVDVLSVMDYKCSGRTSCSLNVDDDKLYQTKPCPTDTTPHLQASYSCIKGKSFIHHQG